MQSKNKIYSLFQFVAFLAIIVLFTWGIFSGYTILHINHGNTDFNIDEWTNIFSESIRWVSTPAFGRLPSVLIYVSMILFVLSWSIGYLIFLVEKRTMFDSLFLVFVMVPVFANVFALIAQFSSKQFIVTNKPIDKDKIIQEQTRTIQLLILKEKEKEKIEAKKEELKKQKELDKKQKLKEKQKHKKGTYIKRKKSWLKDKLNH